MRDNFAYIHHILDSIETIETYTANMDYDKFFDTRLVQDGVIRQIEIMGEAVKNIDPEFKDEHPGVQWKKIAGMRDKLIHHYFGVNIKKVWRTVEKDLPRLKEKIEMILKEEA